MGFDESFMLNLEAYTTYFTSLTFVPSYKDFGTMVDSEPNFHDQINALI